MTFPMQKYIVTVPVADLRKDPSPHKKIYEKDLLQESQLIFGEQVLGLHEQGDWIFIEAVEQKKWVPDSGWKGYPGWVKKNQLHPVEEFPSTSHIIDATWQPIYNKPNGYSDLKYTVSFGTALSIVDELSDFWVIQLHNKQYGFTPKKGIREKNGQPNRQDICRKGTLFLNAPYLWGGRSAFTSNLELGITSMDCSGLTNLLYRINGLDIPRDAHDQFLKCTQKDYDALQPGDLVFTADRTRPERITHVMIHLSPETLLESSLAPKCVRLISTNEKLGMNCQGLKSGIQTEKDVVYFGSFF